MQLFLLLLSCQVVQIPCLFQQFWLICERPHPYIGSTTTCVVDYSVPICPCAGRWPVVYEHYKWVHTKLYRYPHRYYIGDSVGVCLQELDAVQAYATLVSVAYFSIGDKLHRLGTRPFVVKLYGFCLSIAYIARQRHPYIESLPNVSLCYLYSYYGQEYPNGFISYITQHNITQHNT